MINEKLLQKITNKWPVKVLSAAAALIISILFRMNTLETRFFSVPLRVEPNESLVPASSLTSAVRISLRGESDGIQPILEDDIEAFIDLAKYSNEGTYRVPVQILKKGSALGVAPLEISVLPIEIPLTLEQNVMRSIPIFPVFLGTVAQGYELVSQQIIPEMIIAEGPRSVVNDIIEFNTEIIDLDRRYENFSVRINIVNDNPLIFILGERMIEYRGTIQRIIREQERSNTQTSANSRTAPSSAQTEREQLNAEQSEIRTSDGGHSNIRQSESLLEDHPAGEEQ